MACLAIAVGLANTEIDNTNKEPNKTDTLSHESITPWMIGVKEKVPSNAEINRYYITQS